MGTPFEPAAVFGSRARWDLAALRRSVVSGCLHTRCIAVGTCRYAPLATLKSLMHIACKINIL